MLMVIVKGMWDRKPNDWPPDTVFVDPNNKIKTEIGTGAAKSTKPTKDLLVPMLSFLFHKYLVRTFGVWTQYWYFRIHELFLNNV